jgi:hypothetical protein
MPGQKKSGRTGRPQKTESGLVGFHMRMPRDLLEAFDLEVQEIGRAGFTRSDLIREVLYEHAAKVAKKRAKK